MKRLRTTCTHAPHSRERGFYFAFCVKLREIPAFPSAGRPTLVDASARKKRQGEGQGPVANAESPRDIRGPRRLVQALALVWNRDGGLGSEM